MAYRTPHPPPDEEDELWLRLDCALERAFQDPIWAWGVAWQVARDAMRYPEVRSAAEQLMDSLHGGR